MKNLNKTKEELKQLRRERMIPFSSMEDDLEGVDQIHNNEIYKDLKEIDQYLEKNNPRSSKRLY